MRFLVGKASLAIFFSIVINVWNASATELQLRCQYEDKKPITISKAELILVAWGRIERLPLDAGGSLATVPLDAEWLESKTSILPRDITHIHLYIQAQGYAPMCSKSFRWPGLATLDGTFDTAEISFPGGSSFTVRKGEKAAFVLELRRPRARSLKLVDEGGSPLEGITVDSYMYSSSDYNHCARLSADDFLGSATSGADGRVVVPDGDFEYAFEIDSPHIKTFLKEPKNPALPHRLYAFLDQPETAVVLHRLERRTLKLTVLRNAVPAPGEELDGSMSDCPCGACFAAIGASDKDGIIYVPDFYPEAYDRIFFPAKAGGFIWESDPRNTANLEYAADLGDRH